MSYIPNAKNSASSQMQASSLILVKHFDYFTWISFNQVLGVLTLTDADVKTYTQKTIYNYKILERLHIVASGWHVEQFLALTKYSERNSRNIIWISSLSEEVYPFQRSKYRWKITYSSSPFPSEPSQSLWPGCYEQIGWLVVHLT